MNKLICCLLMTTALMAADWKAGISRINITPDGSIWMSGYGSRTKPSEGKIHDLWAKAVALEDRKGNRAVIVTTDIIGFPRSVADQVSTAVLKQYGLDRSRLLLNSSHTHTGPMVAENLRIMFDLPPEQEEKIRAYSQKLVQSVIDVVGAAIADLQPADLFYGSGTADFAVNRRQFNLSNVAIGVNRDGPVDHSVPVLAIRKPDGTLRLALYGYACHNTTLTGEFYQLSGDYAGFSQIDFEKEHPGAMGMFMLLTGGDQNPNPRSQQDLAIKHGSQLARSVSEVLKTKMTPVESQVKTAFQTTELPFAPRTREDFEKELEDSNKVKVRRAQMMLKAMDERRPIKSVTYPVQAIRLGKQVTYIALGGEVVVGYSLRTKKEFPRENTVVAGYSNDVMSYIPTAKVLKEGGYEAVDSMIYYGKPGPFTPDVEERIMKTIHSVMQRVGRKQ